MNNKIHIQIADTGWILEKCAREISRLHDDISVGTYADPTASLQYYINYSARTRRVSPVEVAFFTHSEMDPVARRRYFDAAREVDHCVCMSARYAQELIDSGISPDKVTTISPGVDLDQFCPKVRIGVIGRTYHTGRKGEALIAEVMDVPGIEWRFTGSGWPGPSLNVAEGGMSDFYNDLDYVIVPSLYEGGPMSVLEGLACGVPIISSDVGWVSEYPHIPFENGNAESLRSVLNGLVAEREALRAPVLGRTWDRWAEEHLRLFARLLGELPEHSSKPGKDASSLQVALVTHGTESKSIGGPSVRVPRTASELAELGISATLPQEHPDNFDESQLVHVFNVWPVDSCFRALDRARTVGKRTVLSPIFLNLSNIQFAAKRFPRIFSDSSSPEHIEAALAEIAQEIADEPNLPIREPFPGFHERVRSCVEAADHVIFLSEYERRCLEFIGAKPRAASFIRNPVNTAAFAAADRHIFVERFGIEDFILCVGRIEPRKNQLVLAHAAKTLGKQVVFIGHTEDRPYYDLVRQTAGEHALFIPRIDPADPLLKSAFAAAGAFCLPSWAEGAPLAALEAAAAGLPLVLSDRSSESEYFGEFAEYVNPADVEALRNALERSQGKRHDEERRAALQKHVVENNSWDNYARETASVYEHTIGAQPRSLKPEKCSESIFFDLTTTFHASGNPTGIARVEGRAFAALVSEFGSRIVPIFWNGRTQRFVAVSSAAALRGISGDDLDQLEEEGELHPISGLQYRGGQILVLGGAWIRNRQYIGSLDALKKETGANLTLLVHDLIQMKLKHLYPAGIGEEFEQNARRMARLADNFLVYSECSHRDLKNLLVQNSEFFKKIGRFRLGGMTGLHTRSTDADGNDKSELQQQFSGKKFAIYVSTVEIRKNHALLINVWRRLIEERGAATPQLLFIGRSLWRGDEVVDSIRRDATLRQYVHVLEDVCDADLDWFYSNCIFTLYPSLYEGWGLPVAESLAYGKVCITSDRTATREIAPELTDLADPYDFRAWRDRIAYYLDNPKALERAEQKILRDYKQQLWEDAGKQIVSAMDGAPIADVAAPMIYPGETVQFFADAKSHADPGVCAGGWGNVEKGGRWSLGERSRLIFRYPARGSEFHMQLHLRALAHPGKTRRVRIVLNRHSEEILELPGTETYVQVTIPVRRAKNSTVSINEIEFEPLELLSPNMISGGPDRRLLGVQLIAAQAADERSKLDCQVADEVEATTALSPVAPSVQPPAEKDVDALLERAREVITLPPRFTGKRPILRLSRALGVDRIWLRAHKRRFRRAYDSLNLIINYLQQEKRQ